MTCPMRGCDEPRVTKFCEAHTARLRDNPDWIPVRLADDGETWCGLCGHPVVALPRAGEPEPHLYYLERPAHENGRCRIDDGAFTVLTAEEAERAARQQIPLYRSHPPKCPARAAALAVRSEAPC